MLEFKDVCIRLDNGSTSIPFSLVMSEGDLVCLSGAAGTGKSKVLLAVLGLEPLVSGYITVDGELVAPGSSEYFRRMIAYVPQQLPEANIKVSELCREVLPLQDEGKSTLEESSLMAVWDMLGIDHACYKQSLPSVNPDELRRILLSLLSFQHRSIILIDHVLSDERIISYLKELVANGSEILYTCRTNMMSCTKIINI